MKIIPFLTAAALASVALVSCKNATTGLPIPKDASMVVHINASSLSRKLSWKEISSTEWFQAMSQEQHDSLAKKLMADPDASGVDIKSDFALFTKKQGRGQYFVFEGKLRDASAFEAMVKEMDKDHSKIEKDDDLKYISKDRNFIGWTNSKFFLLSDASYHNPMMNDSEPAANNPLTADSLKKFVKDLMALSSGNSLESDDHFKSLLKESGDVHLWMNMEQYYSGLQGTGMNNMFAPMLQTMGNLFKGNITTGVLNFEDGKISMKSKQYLGGQMKAVMDKYSFKPVTEDLVNRIPSDNVAGAVVMNYPPEAMKDILKAMGMDGMANFALGKMNYSLDELIQATKGQVVLAVTDFTMATTMEMRPDNPGITPATRPDAKILLALSVNNKSSFDKLVGLAEAQIKDSAQRAIFLSKIHYQSTNEWFAVSNASESVNGFIAGGNHHLPFAGKISGHPFGAYFDIQRIIKGFHPESSNAGILDSSMNIWKDVVITGGDYKDGVSTGEMTVNFVDQSVNSLKQLNQYADKMYKDQKKRQAEMMRNFRGIDSLAVPGEAPKAN
jgi:hypothetical protein